jgi:hypothetical protein
MKKVAQRMKNLRKKGWILNEKLKFKKVIEWMKS